MDDPKKRRKKERENKKSERLCHKIFKEKIKIYSLTINQHSDRAVNVYDQGQIPGLHNSQTDLVLGYTRSS